MRPAPTSSPKISSRRSVPLLFGLTSLFADMTYELAHVLLPALMLHLGGSAVATALMESVAEGTKMGGFLSGGRLSSSPEKDSLLVRGGYGLTVLATVLMGAAGSAGALIGLKSLSWFGKGLRGPSRDALLSNALAPEELPGAFGTVRALDQTGGLIGPLMALALSGLLSPGRILFMAALPGLLCVLFSILATRSALTFRIWEKTSSSPTASGLFAPSLLIHFEKRVMRSYFIGGTLLRVGMLPATLLMFRFASEGGSFAVMAAGFLLSSLLTVLVNLMIAKKRLPGSPWLLVGLAAPLLALSALLLAPGRPNNALYLLAMASWGAGEACASVGLKVHGASLWLPELRSRGFALFELSASLCSLLVWPLLGIFWDRGQGFLGMGIAVLASCAGGGVLAVSAREWRKVSGSKS